jgi:hypothetical protein
MTIVENPNEAVYTGSEYENIIKTIKTGRTLNDVKVIQGSKILNRVVRNYTSTKNLYILTPCTRGDLPYIAVKVGAITSTGISQRKNRLWKLA